MPPKKKAAPKERVDIFKVLSNLDLKQHQPVLQMTPDERKQLSPYILMRWMSGVRDPIQINRVNDRVNRIIWNLPKDPGGEGHDNLLVMLLSSCGNGKSQRHNWVQPKVSKKNQNIVLEVISASFGYSRRESAGVVELLSRDQILKLAEDLGYDDDVIKKLEKELG